MIFKQNKLSFWNDSDLHHGGGSHGKDPPLARVSDSVEKRGF